MKIAYNSIYRYANIPENHRFPMDKYELLPQQLLLEGIAEPSDFFDPTPVNEEQVLRTHDKEYWDKVQSETLSKKEIRALGFPFHPNLAKRGLRIAGGTLDCFYHAKKEGVALNIAGGTHHSYADRGEGFCLFNDFAIAATELLHRKDVNKILIIDLDVHQGNGTAKIFTDEPRVFTCSVHGQNNYPLHKEKSDLDIGVPDGIEDEAYIDIIKRIVPNLIKMQKPDVIFYLSGVDVLSTDKLGRLGLSKEGCKKRDKIVFSHAKNAEIPVVVAMGGGYSEQIRDIVDAHTNTYKAAKEIFEL